MTHQPVSPAPLSPKRDAPICAQETARTTELPSSSAPLAAGMPLVQGRCPACGTTGLFLGSGGYVTCSLIECREPDAASTVLDRQPVPVSGTERRARYKAAVNTIVGYPSETMVNAVMAVADTEQAELRARAAELGQARAETERLKEQHKASLRRADDLNNALMAEVQRYAEGTERPVLWSVYNRMHGRTLKAEAEREQLRAALTEVLGIMAGWCVEANNQGGVDATDLAFRLEQAGYPLPDEETTTPAEEAAS